ncbi:MAG: peptidylprolyl isomerase [Bacteroidales bacterium]|jgi:peptidyl-prolyl cis-trans isomerase SurA|nr:peptidylprolyl isomerase [Bacteroidales bacterium]
MLQVFSQKRVAIDGIIVVVGKEIITRSDMEKMYKDYSSQYAVTENPEEVRCLILEKLVAQKLYVHQADLDSIIITPQEVDKQIDDLIRYHLQQIGGDTKILETFYGKSMDEIKKDLRPITRENMLVQRIQDKLTENIAVTPSEVKSFYEQTDYDSLPSVPAYYEFGHIVKSPPVSDEELGLIKSKLEEYRERALRGDKFSTLARLYSDDPGTATKGGEVGFTGRGELYPEFEAVAFKLKTGEISPVVQTKAGYHIIKLLERRGEQINVAHILLQPKPSIENQVKAIEYLDSIKKVITQEHIEFTRAAQIYSDDPNKNSGGWVISPYTLSSRFTKENLEPALYSAIDKLIPGEYSSPMPYVNEDGKMSYRLLYLKSKVPAHKPNLAEDYDMIQNAAIEEKKMKIVDKWLMNKVKVTSIKINDEFRDCPFVKKWQIP